MSKILTWWVGIPLLVFIVFLATRWSVARQEAKLAAKLPTVSTATGKASDPTRREYVLEVIGLGVTYEKYRQGMLWRQIKQGHPYASIREQDPMKYPWSGMEKDGVGGGRVNDSLVNGAKGSPIYWAQPAFHAGGPDDPKEPASPINCPTVIGDPTSTGMGGHIFVCAGWEESERPDRLLERVFAFFDEHPDVPHVVLSSEDSLHFRNLYRREGTPALVQDGHYIPDMPDSSALFLLARRERIDPVRPFVFEDFDARMDTLPGDDNVHGYARRQYLAHLKLSQSVTKPKDALVRDPTVAEWLDATRAFAQREDIYPKGVSLLAERLNPLQDGRHPPRGYRPTPWFPIPWNTYQLEAFDKRPTLGFLHRPVFVPTVDEHGEPLARREARVAALAAGWQEALLTLPEAERKAAPARVVVSSGKPGPAATDQTIAISRVFGGWAESGGTEIDRSKPDRWIDTEARLGNTGAATWFMQMALGVMGSYEDGGVSAAINLRDPREASIVLISPPPEVRRQSQGDVFGFKPTPAIDPANYAPK